MLVLQVVYAAPQMTGTNHVNDQYEWLTTCLMLPQRQNKTTQSSV